MWQWGRVEYAGWNQWGQQFWWFGCLYVSLKWDLGCSLGVVSRPNSAALMAFTRAPVWYSQHSAIPSSQVSELKWKLSWTAQCKTDDSNSELLSGSNCKQCKWIKTTKKKKNLLQPGRKQYSHPYPGSVPCGSWGLENREFTKEKPISRWIFSFFPFSEAAICHLSEEFCLFAFILEMLAALQTKPISIMVMRPH